MTLGNGSGPSIAFAVLLALAAGASAQHVKVPPNPPEQAGMPRAQPMAGQQSSPPQQSQPPEQPDDNAAPKRLGRPFPAGAVAPPAPPEEPDVSVSVVSPQESPVFGRRTRIGNQRIREGGRAMQGMGDGGGALDGGSTDSDDAMSGE